MLITFKHHVHILDATDGYIEEPLMVELEKLKTPEVEIEITVDYSAGRPARKPDFRDEVGHPADPEEWETEDDAEDYAFQIIEDLCKGLNGIPVSVILEHGSEIAGSMKEGITDNIQYYIDQELPDAITSYLEDR